MADADISAIYRRYIDCLNRRDWTSLDRFVDAGVRHNGRAFGVSGYRAMLEQNVEDIPDLRFDIDMLITELPFVAARLKFDCAPKGMFLGLAVNGRKVSFTENAFYRFDGAKIAEVWSVVDKAAIEAQL